MKQTSIVSRIGFVALALLAVACAQDKQEADSAASPKAVEAIAGTYDCGPEKDTGQPHETWDLREDGKLTVSISGEKRVEGTWSLEGEGGVVNLPSEPDPAKFTIDGDRLVFGPVEPGSSNRWACTPES